jgi:hypothetical protein
VITTVVDPPSGSLRPARPSSDANRIAPPFMQVRHFDGKTTERAALVDNGLTYMSPDTRPAASVRPRSTEGS